jgi:DNA/RNA-binding domain of Phe-tRNA-synthetase-like protein
MWFVLEALDPMPDAALIEAGKELIRELKVLSPGFAVEACLLAGSGSTAFSPDNFR